MQSTINARGQITIPAALRREMGLVAGQTVRWEWVSDTECRVVFEALAAMKADPAAGARSAKHSGSSAEGRPLRRPRKE